MIKLVWLKSGIFKLSIAIAYIMASILWVITSILKMDCSFKSQKGTGRLILIMCLIEPLSFQHVILKMVRFYIPLLKINLLIHLLICFWLHWVFVTAHGLYLVAVSGSYLCCLEWASHCGSFPCCGVRPQ